MLLLVVWLLLILFAIGKRPERCTPFLYLSTA
jgi:hypothetical protein